MSQKTIFSRSRLILLTVGWCLLVPLSGKYSTPLAEEPVLGSYASAYVNRIALIDEGKTLISMQVLLSVKLFKELSAEGIKNIDACIEFLATNGYPPQQRTIAILSMHELNAHDYVIFLKRMLKLYHHNLVSRDELGLSVVPGNDFSTVLLEHYLDDEVRTTLQEISRQDGVRSSTRSAIANILSGKALEDMKKFRRDCCTPRN